MMYSTRAWRQALNNFCKRSWCIRHGRGDKRSYPLRIPSASKTSIFQWSFLTWVYWLRKFSVRIDYCKSSCTWGNGPLPTCINFCRSQFFAEHFLRNEENKLPLNIARKWLLQFCSLWNCCLQGKRIQLRSLNVFRIKNLPSFGNSSFRIFRVSV